MQLSCFEYSQVSVTAAVAAEGEGGLGGTSSEPRNIAR